MSASRVLVGRQPRCYRTVYLTAVGLRAWFELFVAIVALVVTLWYTLLPRSRQTLCTFLPSPFSIQCIFLAMPCSAAYFRTSSVIFMLQKCGPDAEQKCAVFAPSCGKVSSWNSLAVMGSSERLNWSSHLNSNLAFESALSRYCAPGCPFAKS